MNDVVRALKFASEAAEWRRVPALMREYAAAAAPIFKCAAQFPHVPDREVYFNPASRTLWFSWSPQDGEFQRDEVKLAFARACDPHVEKVAEAVLDAPCGEEPWMRVKMGLEMQTLLRPVGQALGYIPGGPSHMYGPFGPSPVAAMLGTGLLGAGLGYAGGAALEHFMPELFEEGRLRKRTAMLGGALGALPGAWWASANVRNDQNVTDAWPHPSNAELALWPEVRAQYEQAREEAGEDFRDRIVTGLSFPLLSEEKRAWGSPTRLLYAPIIPVDEFNQTLWADPNTPPADRAAVAGVVDAAGLSRGNADFVSPMDVARIAVGAGSGYASGVLVGKTLGALAGITPEAQRTLQQAGTWAGIIQNLVPHMFGGY